MCGKCRGKGIDFDLVPVNEILTSDMRAFKRAYVAYRAGIPPESGGSNDQPHTFMEAVDVMDEELFIIAEEMREEQARKAGN